MSHAQRLTVVGLLALIAAGVVWYRFEVYKDPRTLIDHPNLVLVTGGSSSYWQLLCKGAAAAAEDMGAELVLKSPENDENVQEQTDLLLSIDASQFDGVALSPLDAEQQTRLINDYASKAMVFTVDSDAPLSNRVSFVGASNYAAGLQCAELLLETLEGGGGVLVLAANMTKDNMQERLEGLEERLQDPPGADAPTPEIEVLEVLIDEGDIQRCRDQLVKAIEAHPELAGVVGLNSYHGGLIAETLEAMGLVDRVDAVAFDAVEATLDAIEQGKVYATVAQDPYQYGYETVSRLVTNCQLAKPQLPLVGIKSTVNISTKKLYAKDIAEYRLQYNARLGIAETTTAE